MERSPDDASSRVSKLVFRGASLVAASLFVLGGLLLIWLWDVDSVRHFAANLLGSYLLLWGVAFLVLRGSNRELHLSFALSTVSFGLILVVLETLPLLGLVDYRLLFGTGTPGATPWLNPKNLFDEELLVVRRPHSQVSGTKRGNIADIFCLPEDVFSPYSYDIRYDHNGFRNDQDLSEAKIVLLGDSYVEAVKTPYNETLSHHLTELSEARVANLGLSSYGPDQMLVVLRRFALPLNPEVIVWAFYEGNDLVNIDHYARQTALARSGRLRTRPTRRELSFTKNALHALYNLTNKCDPSSLAERFSGVFRAKDGRELDMYFLAGARQRGAEELSALERLEEILDRAHELAADSGAKLLLIYIPTKFRVYGKFVEAPARSELEQWDVTDLPSRVMAIAREVSSEIGVLDLTPSLDSAAAEGELVYFLDDTHWTPKGHRVAAEAIWRFLSDWDRPLNETP